jgi:hypothetical protein
MRLSWRPDRTCCAEDVLADVHADLRLPRRASLTLALPWTRPSAAARLREAGIERRPRDFTSSEHPATIES